MDWRTWSPCTGLRGAQFQHTIATNPMKRRSPNRRRVMRSKELRRGPISVRRVICRGKDSPIGWLGAPDRSMWCDAMATVRQKTLRSRPSTHPSTLSTLTGAVLTSTGSETPSFGLIKVPGQYQCTTTMSIRLIIHLSFYPSNNTPAPTESI